MLSKFKNQVRATEAQHWQKNLEQPASTQNLLVLISSVARGGGGAGGLEPPHWLVKYAKSHVFCAFEADFMWKMENSPPIRKQPPLKRLNLRNWTKFQAQFWWRPFFFFFGDHLILGGINLSISELSKTFRLNFRTNRLKLIQDQWKFESRLFAHFSLFQNSSPPPFPNPGYAPGSYIKRVPTVL